MWVSALIGMMTAYGETMLGIRYRYKGTDGHYLCGPFVYMERGLGVKGMAVLYSFFCLLCSLGNALPIHLPEQHPHHDTGSGHGAMPSNTAGHNE